MIKKSFSLFLFIPRLSLQRHFGIKLIISDHSLSLQKSLSKALAMFYDYVKQRRNFMAIGLVLFFYKFGGLRFDEFTIFGNKVIVENPHVVGIFLTGAWIYWGLRFFHSFLEIKDKGIKADFYVLMSNSAKTIATNLFQKYPPEYPSDLKPNYSIVIEHCGIYEFSTKYVRSRIKYAYILPEKNYHTKTSEKEIVLTTRNLLVSVIFNGAKILLFRRYFLEYVFPFFIGLSPAGYLLWIILFQTN